LSGGLISMARRVDDFIIDRLLQPSVNRADWHFGLPLYTLARACVVLGCGVGLIWVHRFDLPFSLDFFEDLACVSIMAGVAVLQIRSHERHAPKRPVLAPAIRLTGLLWRTLWLLDLALFPSQLTIETTGQLLGNFAWTLLLILPYWLVCCRVPPPPERRVSGVVRTVPVFTR